MTRGNGLAVQLDRLILGQVAQTLPLDLSVRVLVNRERGDHANGDLFMQPLY